MEQLTRDYSDSPIFIHSSLDDAGLDGSEFRVYAHLCRRANNGVAWPGIDSMAKVCRYSKTTIIESIRGLENRGLLRCVREPGKTTRYLITSSKEWLPFPGLDSPATVTRNGTDHSNPGNATVPRNGTKGNPTKVIQEGNPVETKPEPSADGYKFADWFKTLVPAASMKAGWRDAWAKCFDDMMRLDGRTKEQIAAVCRWARKDDFWITNFLSPLKLRKRNRDDVMYFDVFLQKSTTTTNGNKINSNAHSRNVGTHNQGRAGDYSKAVTRAAPASGENPGNASPHR